PDTPDLTSELNVNFRYDSNVDQGVGVWWVYPNAATMPDKYNKVRGRHFVNYLTPPLRLPSTLYEGGAVFTANGKTYKVITPGTTDATTGPSTIGNGPSDGSAKVDYIQATPSLPANLGAGQFEAITDADLEYTFYGTAFGVAVANRGSSDQT